MSPQDRTTLESSQAPRFIALGAGLGMIVGAAFTAAGSGMVLGAAAGWVAAGLLERIGRS